MFTVTIYKSHMAMQFKEEHLTPELPTIIISTTIYKYISFWEKRYIEK